MSKAISALEGASFSGLAHVSENGLTGMVTVRGDFSNEALQKSIKTATGCAVPALRKISQSGISTVVWMSPDELLIVTAHANAQNLVVQLNEALKDQHALVANVSDARACFSISGVDAREVLSKLAPVDFTETEFQAGDVRRTRVAQIAAAVWQDDSGDFTLVCFRSVAEYAFNLLKTAAHPLSRVMAQ